MTSAHGDMACLPNAEVPHGSLRRRMGKSGPTQAFRIRQAALTSVDMLRGCVRRSDLFREHTARRSPDAGICTISIPIMHSGD
jgi:hypothetical protein